MKKIVVNGVDGNFGKLVVEDVLKLIPKEKLLFTAPRADKLENYKKMGIKTAVADFNNSDNLTKIFENADKVLLISMPFVGVKRRKAHKNCVEACVKAHVGQIIYTSVLSSGNPFNPSVENADHGYTESIIQNTDLDYIILRNSLFAEAFITDYLRAVNNHEDNIEKNMGEGRVWFISRRDAALSAACALNNDLLHRAILNINGCEPFTYDAFLKVANEVTGNNISYVKKTDQELYDYFDSIGVPRNTDGDFSKSPIQATSEGMVTFGTTVRDGYLDVPVSDFTKLCGKKQITVRNMFENEENFQLGDRHSTE